MKTRKLVIGFIALFFFLLNTSNALADKSVAKIEAPDEAVKGSEVVIKVLVSHSANNFFHHTDWVSVKANGKEIGRWEYSMTNLPEGAHFTKEIKLTVNEDLVIEAKANCNLHGSAGADTKKISVK
jgi:desulfoferrodoxin (superoxide reductase-like protein)